MRVINYLLCMNRVIQIQHIKYNYRRNKKRERERKYPIWTVCDVYRFPCICQSIRWSQYRTQYFEEKITRVCNILATRSLAEEINTCIIVYILCHDLYTYSINAIKKHDDNTLSSKSPAINWKFPIHNNYINNDRIVMMITTEMATTTMS